MTETKTATTQEVHEAYLNLGLALRRAGDSAEAIEILRRAIAREPDSAAAHLALGLALLDHEQYDEAVEALQKALELAPPDDRATRAAACFNLGVAQRKLGHYRQAVEAFERALEFGHETADLWHLLGDSLARDKRLDEALQAFDRAIALDPQQAEAHRRKGRT
ncbi:MAG: tetratricopeptide repeat protein, partial [Anaerolineae bacterium]